MNSSPEEFIMPIMAGEKAGEKRLQFRWPVTAEHRRQADRNHGQTLERLRERGGLCWTEMEGVLTGKRWGDLRRGPGSAEAARYACLTLFPQDTSISARDQ